ncbi:hypothetical protein LZQ00_10940 [Sphingobacterium sp. SRCM116780]|uniref:hypothetical protein n=1 Tax=Sphingobacterium sp. SRCM116780 TaxID=2907623 RepID=UPI001F17770A|nr:hypothetical protein [Sphingobacterium sp. SRCM116780]UIR54792.1 hypothetical protein LZQ00_10940 [Sphingobacterium sp. SRCM116780]
MKKLLLTLCVFLYAHASFSQDTTIIYDTERISNEKFDTLNNAVKTYHRLLHYNDPILYVGILPSFKSAKTRAIPLQDGEGKKGYLLEGNLIHRLPIYKAHYYSPKWTRRMRITFDAGFTIRMTKDNSSPLLPSNNRFGLGLDYLLSSIENQENPFRKLHVWTTLQIHHYSNGQSDNGFYESTNPLRNKYKNGDFSTNYIRLSLYASKEVFERSLFSGSLGYQRDLGIGSLFKLSPELKNSYGLNNMLLTFQWLQRPKYRVVEIPMDKKRYIDQARHLAFRSEMSYILDSNLGLFPGTNKYRFGVHNYLTYYPIAKGNIGFIGKHYFGRDYLNIRYDDVVNSYQLGLVIDIAR